MSFPRGCVISRGALLGSSTVSHGVKMFAGVEKGMDGSESELNRSGKGTEMLIEILKAASGADQGGDWIRMLREQA